jgi:serine/threonine protein kinase
MISLLLLIVLAVCIFCGVILAILNFAMLVYKEFRTKKEHDNNNFNKEKKVGGGAGGNKKKKARKGSNLMKGSSGEDLHEGGGGPKQYSTENGSEALVDGAKNPGKKWQWMDTAAYGDGIQVGRLFVTKVTIGAGSNGTTVFEGYLDGRKVAVKRLLGHYYEKAQKEIALLITSDEHPNVVRYYAMEETPDFIYVALERCSLSLNDLILSQSAQSPFQNDKRDSINLTDEKQLKLASGKELKLWDKEGYPSLQLLQLMRYDCSKQYLRDNDSPIFFMIDLENMEFLEVCCRRVRIKD